MNSKSASQTDRKTIDTETDDTDSIPETESLLSLTPSRMADHEVGKSSSASVTSEKVAR